MTVTQKRIEWLNPVAVLDYAIENNMSIARFGDGELVNFIYNPEGIKNDLFHEEFNLRLRYELTKLLMGDKSKSLLVCIFPCITQNHFNKCKQFQDDCLENFKRMHLLFFDFFEKLGAPDILGDAFCFRRVRCEEKEKNEHRKKIAKYFKSKKVLTVSSMKRDELEKLEIYKDFDIIRINPSNSFRDIDDIESRTLEKYNSGKYDIITCSAGPTASVLANRFAEKGIMLWDIGQVNRI